MSTTQLKPGREVKWRGTSGKVYFFTFVRKDEFGTNPRFYFTCPEFACQENPKGITSMKRTEVNRECLPA